MSLMSKGPPLPPEVAAELQAALDRDRDRGGPRLKMTREWFERRVALEGDLEVGAGAMTKEQGELKLAGLDLDALEKVALDNDAPHEHARPWEVHLDSLVKRRNPSNEHVATSRDYADYIATFDPPTVLKLIAALRAMIEAVPSLVLCGDEEVTGSSCTDLSAHVADATATVKPCDLEALRWIAVFASVRASDPPDVFRKVARSALVTIAEKAKQAALACGSGAAASPAGCAATAPSCQSDLAAILTGYDNMGPEGDYPAAVEHLCRLLRETAR